ncbi:MAG: HupE/UreJ family protein [Bacteroidia bacterium]|nr:HupE/UreJ family protein [Bacteroidia bacterium]
MPILLRSNARYLFLVAALLFPFLLSAHPADEALANMPRSAIAAMYLKLGFTHILPLGLDHILFVVCLFLLNPKLKPVLWQATAFTVAHSITLALSMYGVISPPASIVEPVIALSIFFVAAENIITDKLKPTRIILVFAFGLIHGLGFAGVLSELGLPQGEFVTALILFNVGVELGQIAVIVALWLLIGLWFSEKKWYRKGIVTPLSVLIAIIAIYWTIERTFFS